MQELKKQYSPLFIINTGQIPMHHCMVWTEVECPQVGSHSPEKAAKKDYIIQPDNGFEVCCHCCDL